MIRAVLLAALLCGGCATQVRGTGEGGMTDAELEAKDDSTCAGFGAAKGSPAYIDCRLKLRQIRSSEDSGRRLRAAL